MIGIVGCGAMGSAMVQRLLEQGETVVCYDSSDVVRANMTRTRAEVVGSLHEVAARCGIVILSLPKAEVVRAVMDELDALLERSTIVLDTSTSEPDTTRELAARAASNGYEFIDGPVSGGPRGARNGSMTMVLGGAEKPIRALGKVLKHLTSKTVHIGPPGSGHATKIANNLLCAANLVLLSEMARLAQTQGVTLESLLQGVNAGSGRSGVSEVNFPQWIVDAQYNSGFTMGLMRKDVGLAVTLADRTALALPATRAIAEIWRTSEEALPASADFNEIYKLENSADV